MIRANDYSRNLPVLLALLSFGTACTGSFEEETAVAVQAQSEETQTEAAAGISLDYPHRETLGPGEYTAYNQRASLIQRGGEVYAKYCVGCHGEYGDGNGVASVRLITKPRDFRSGIYKFRSTDSGSLPMESDLHRTITQGLARVSMPAFPLMPETEKVAVIEYIKTFYPRWEEEKAQRHVVPLPQAPDDLRTGRRQLRGRAVFLTMQCNQCHGIDGRGTGATQTEYEDAWGHPQKPFDFTRGRLKGGGTPEDIYRTFHTGLRSIMPAYDPETLATVTQEALRQLKGQIADAELSRLEPVLEDYPASPADLMQQLDVEKRAELGERNSWDLVSYILSLRSDKTTASAVLGAAN